MRVLTQNKRKEILKAAAQLFAAKGFHRTQMDQVAQQAGIGKGTIYRYFPGKEDLYFSILDQAVSDLQECLMRDFRESVRPQHKLVKMMSDMAELFLRNRSLLKLIHEIENGEIKKRHQNIRRQNDKIVSLIADAVREGIRSGEFKRGDPRLLAAQLAVMTRMSVVEFPQKGKQALVAGVMDTFLHGISKNRKHS